MKKGIGMTRISVWLLLGFFVCASAFADPPQGYAFLSFDQGLRTAKEQHKKIFVYFGRFGCAYCDIVNKTTFIDPDLKALYSKNYVLVYVDAESGKRLRLPTGERISEAELGVHYQVFGTPMFVYLEPDGKIITSVPGMQSVQNFKDYDRYVTEGHYRTQSLVNYLKGKE
jgi:thioredoxin-related protein